jgi:hypothetical protein
VLWFWSAANTAKPMTLVFGVGIIAFSIYLRQQRSLRLSYSRISHAAISDRRAANWIGFVRIEQAALQYPQGVLDGRTCEVRP